MPLLSLKKGRKEEPGQPASPQSLEGDGAPKTISGHMKDQEYPTCLQQGEVVFDQLDKHLW